MYKECSVYHICRESDRFDYSKGYIGVSKDTSKRWSRHRTDPCNPHLGNALDKYDDISFYVLVSGSEKYCYELEEELRPDSEMGWNIIPGGTKPPRHLRVNYTHSNETKVKLCAAQQRLRPFHSERMTGDKNPQYGAYGSLNPNFQGYYHTPEGIFESQSQVVSHYGISRPAVNRRCVKGGVIKQSRWTSPDMWGKTWEEAGWYLRRTI